MKKHNDEQYYIALELDKVLAKLSDCTDMADAKELSLTLSPSSDMEEVKRRLNETDEAYVLSAKFGAPSFGSARNVINPLSRAAAGAVLSMREFLDIGETLRVIRSVKEWRKNSESNNTPITDALFDALTPSKYLEDRIFNSIKNEEELFDTASPELSNIRRHMRACASNVRDRLDKMIKGGATAKYLQDAIVTQRDGRFVVPVKVEYRAQVPGLVHDTSSSGATVFIEPMAVVKINNEIKILQSKEKEEIERILAELSADAAGISKTAAESYKALVNLSFIFGKADLAYKMRAVKPLINNSERIVLKNARHPLIPDLRVVPISVELGKSFDTLVITGPNTGGKTVAIKTLGLLTLMTMCGLMVPCDDGCELAVFRNIFADIGDEQSIEQSLSTFSAHMTNIISIIKRAGKGSLVLIDELGSGTDPVEGAALATAILDQLRKNGALIAATTHYPELKTYALETDGVANACCEFDIKTLTPTYRLIIGAPGRSNAFAISQKLGLPENIIKNAEKLVSDDARRFETVVAALDEARHNAETEAKKAEKIRIELETVRQKNKQRTDNIQAEKSKILERARNEAMNIVEKARAESSRMLGELEDIKKQENKTAADRLARARAAVKSGIGKLEDTADPVVNNSADNKLNRPPKVGEEVKIIDIDRRGTVLEVDEKSKNALVLAGIIKLRVSFDNLAAVTEKPKPQIPRTRNVNHGISAATRRAALEIDLRGVVSDEAVMELDRFIDDAIISKVHSVSIIHGKGTGVLRKAVADYLRHNRSVASFRLGTFGEGESGVTIAELK